MAGIETYNQDSTVTEFDQLLGVNKSDATTVTGTNLYSIDSIATYMDGVILPAVTEDTNSVNISKDVEITGDISVSGTSTIELPTSNPNELNVLWNNGGTVEASMGVGPVFSPDSYVASLLESRGAGFTVFTVTATVSGGGALLYSLDDAPSFLSIDVDTGVVTLASNIDAESLASTFNFFARATTTTGYSLAAVTLNILGVDDNPPVITSSLSHTIDTNWSVGTLVTTIEASDLDGTPITFSGTNDHFDIESDGRVIVSNPLFALGDTTETISVQALSGAFTNTRDLSITIDQAPAGYESSPSINEDADSVNISTSLEITGDLTVSGDFPDPTPNISESNGAITIAATNVTGGSIADASIGTILELTGGTFTLPFGVTSVSTGSGYILNFLSITTTGEALTVDLDTVDSFAITDSTISLTFVNSTDASAALGGNLVSTATAVSALYSLNSIELVGDTTINGDLTVTGDFPDPTPGITQDSNSINISDDLEVSGRLSAERIINAGITENELDYAGNSLVISSRSLDNTIPLFATDYDSVITNGQFAGGYSSFSGYRSAVSTGGFFSEVRTRVDNASTGESSYVIAVNNGVDANPDLTNPDVEITSGSTNFKDDVSVGGDLTLTGNLNNDSIVFGAASGDVTSKTLDDYEERTFTPVNATDNANVPLAIDYAEITKVGSMVMYNFRFDVPVNASPQFAGISGFPYTVVNNSAASFFDSHGLSNPYVTLSASGQSINIYAGGGGLYTWADLSGHSNVTITGVYITSS